MSLGKRAALLAAALLLFLASQLHLGCRVLVYGRALEGLYSPLAASRAAGAASRTAEEVTAGPPALPQLAFRFRLSLRPPSEDSGALAAQLLAYVPGVALANVVYVDGQRLGTVEDGPELFRRLANYVEGQRPRAAVSGSLSGEVKVARLYSRPGAVTDYNDMVLLVAGMAPAIYLDENGRLA